MVWERVGWGCDAGVRWGAWRGRGAVGCVARAGGAGGWSGHVMGRVARGCGAGHVAVGRSSRADDRGKGIPCGT